MKIVNVIQRYPPAVGGAETWAQEVCRWLARRGHDVEVYAINVNKEEEFWREPEDPDNTIAFGRFEDDQGVKVFRFRRSLPIHLLYHIVFKRLLDRLLGIYFYGPHSSEMYGTLWRTLKRADIVFLHAMPHPHNIIAWLIARWHGKKTVIVPHFHPDHPHYERRSAYYLLDHCDGVVAVTAFERDHLSAHGVSRGKIVVSGNGVHPRLYVGGTIQHDSFLFSMLNDHQVFETESVLLFLGRKMPDKGIDTLIEAVRRVRRRRRIKLLLAGPSFEWFDLLYAALPPEVREDILDIGVVSHSEKVALLKRVTALVLPSRFEAFGIVFLEAWICGLPVIGSERGAMPGLIGDSGYIAAYGDVHDLERAINRLLGEKLVAQEKAQHGRQRVEESYTWDRIGCGIERILMKTAGPACDRTDAEHL